jgi:agmatine/peptidylarginine deiminase
MHMLSINIRNIEQIERKIENDLLPANHHVNFHLCCRNIVEPYFDENNDQSNDAKIGI